MTLDKLYLKMCGILSDAGVPDASVDAFRLFEYVTGLNHAAFYASRDKEADPAQAERLMALTEKRAERIPLQHLTGEQAFMDLTFKVNEHVLIPRFDTEILVETALQKARLQGADQGAHILDIGCGSGCIIISLLHALGAHNGQEAGWSGTGTDISKEALKLARENAGRCGLKECITWRNADLFDGDMTRDYALIVSNPPYIPTGEIDSLEPEVREHDPLTALDGGPDGLRFYRAIIPEARGHLRPGGWLIVEIGFDQREAVLQLFREQGYRQIECVKDLSGHDRVIAGQK